MKMHIYFFGFLLINGRVAESCFFRLFSSNNPSSPTPFHSTQDDLHLDKETISVVQQTLVKTLISLGKLKFNCPRENGTYPDMLDCRKYYNCTNSNFTMGECEDGLGFETSTKTCILSEAVPLCQRVIKLHGHQCNETGLQTFDGDCQKFVLCTGEAAFSSSCNHGDVFDQKYLLCLPEKDVNCTIKPIDNITTNAPLPASTTLLNVLGTNSTGNTTTMSLASALGNTSVSRGAAQ